MSVPIKKEWKHSAYNSEIELMHGKGESSLKIAVYLIDKYGLTDKIGSFAKGIRRALKGEDHRRAKRSPKVSKREWKESGEKAEFTAVTKIPIHTKKQALEIGQVNLKVWEVEHWVLNSWGVTNGAGEYHTNYQVKLWLVRRKKKLSEYYDELHEYIRKNTKPIKFKEVSGAIDIDGVWAFCDTHLGLNNEGNGVDELCRRFNLIADVINLSNRKRNHLMINGDLLESGAGTFMHATQIFEAIPGLTGAAGIRTFWLLFKKHLLERLTVPVTSISVVAGNHDRMAKDKKNISPFGSMAEIFYYFLIDNVPGVEINYDFNLLTKTINGICYILTHGDNSASRNLSTMVHDNRDPDAVYHCLVTAHFHSRKTEKVMVKKSTIIETKVVVSEENLKFRKIQLAPLCRANSYAINLGKSSGCGFSHFERSTVSENVNHHDYACD